MPGAGIRSSVLQTDGDGRGAGRAAPPGGVARPSDGGEREPRGSTPALGHTPPAPLMESGALPGCPPGRRDRAGLRQRSHATCVPQGLLAWVSGVVASFHSPICPSVHPSEPRGKRGAAEGVASLRWQRWLAPRPCVGWGYPRSSPCTARAPPLGARPRAKDTGTAPACWALTDERRETDRPAPGHCQGDTWGHGT